jgi:putative addiction module component (TIGR02574 family)
MTLANLIDEARRLSHAEQAELLDELIRLIGPEETDVALTPAQQIDLSRRYEEYKAGKAKMIPGDQAIAQLKQRS